MSLEKQHTKLISYFLGKNALCARSLKCEGFKGTGVKKVVVQNPDILFFEREIFSTPFNSLIFPTFSYFLCLEAT